MIIVRNARESLGIVSDSSLSIVLVRGVPAKYQSQSNNVITRISDEWDFAAFLLIKERRRSPARPRQKLPGYVIAAPLAPRLITGAACKRLKVFALRTRTAELAGLGTVADSAMWTE
jgi:hypothetical protein